MSYSPPGYIGWRNRLLGIDPELLKRLQIRPQGPYWKRRDPRWLKKSLVSSTLFSQCAVSLSSFLVFRSLPFGENRACYCFFAGALEGTGAERGGYQTSPGRNQLSYLPYFLKNTSRDKKHVLFLFFFNFIRSRAVLKKAGYDLPMTIH